MSHIPNRAMPHAAAPAEDDAPAAPPPRTPLATRDWLTLGGIAALAGAGIATLGTALAQRRAGK